jgi:hypothetical protein
MGYVAVRCLCAVPGMTAGNSRQAKKEGKHPNAGTCSTHDVLLIRNDDFG